MGMNWWSRGHRILIWRLQIKVEGGWLDEAVCVGGCEVEGSGWIAGDPEGNGDNGSSREDP